MFDCDTGILRSGSIGPGSLQDLAPDPSGVGQRVRINAKGQIEEIISERVFTAPRHSLAVFTGASPGTDLVAAGFRDDGDTNSSRDIESTSNSTHGNVYKFTVPDAVTRILANMVQGGARRVGTTNGQTGGWSETVLRVEPGETLTITVGDGAASTSASAFNTNYVTKIESNLTGHVAGVPITGSGSYVEHTVATNVATDAGYSRPFLPYGQGGTAAHASGYGGIVILEWYA